MIHWLYHLISWTWGGDHQGGANSTGYLITSGPLGDVTLITGALAIYWKHVCHAKRCYRIGRLRIDGTPHVVCRKHHPDPAPSVEQLQEAG